MDGLLDKFEARYYEENGAELSYAEGGPDFEWLESEFDRRNPKYIPPAPVEPTDDQKVQAYVDNYNRVNSNSPITVDDIPDRSGFLGGASELLHGVGHAVVDQFPEDVARIYQGSDVKMNDDSLAQEIIDEQERDRGSRVMSKQMILGDGLNESLYQGPASVATSAVIGTSGAVIGGAGGAAVGSAVPVVGTAAGGAIGAMVGAFSTTGPAFYRMAKNQFLHEMLDVAKQNNVNLTPEAWEQIKQDIDSEATEFGLWEAGPEAISQGLTAGMFKGVGGKIFGKVPGFAGITKAISKRAITRAGAKLSAEIAEEEITEYTTYQGQEGIRQDMGLRKDAPSLNEFIDTQAGPVAVGSVLQMGVHKVGSSAMDLLSGKKEVAINESENEVEGNDWLTGKTSTGSQAVSAMGVGLPTGVLSYDEHELNKEINRRGEFMQSHGPLDANSEMDLLNPDVTQQRAEVSPSEMDAEFSAMNSAGEGMFTGHPGYAPTVQEIKRQDFEQALETYQGETQRNMDGKVQEARARGELPATPFENVSAMNPTMPGMDVVEEAQVEEVQPVVTSTVVAQANEAATSGPNHTPKPSEAQIEAGNYKLGHVRAMGLDISIENPAGSERSGTDNSGKKWSVQMQHHYGYIKGTEGKDKDHLDLFLKNGVETQDIESKPVFVVDQINEDGTFDEHKILAGFDNEQDATDGYLSNYEEGWQGLGAITEMSAEEFKTWTKGKTTKPVAYVKPYQVAPNVNTEGVNIKSEGKAYTEKGLRLRIVSLLKQGINAEAVQLDEAGKEWGWREVEDEGPVLDQDAETSIKGKIDRKSVV